MLLPALWAAAYLPTANCQPLTANCQLPTAILSEGDVAKHL